MSAASVASVSRLSSTTGGCDCCDQPHTFVVAVKGRACDRCLAERVRLAEAESDGWLPLTIAAVRPSPAQLWAMAAASPLSPAGGETT